MIAQPETAWLDRPDAYIPGDRRRALARGESLPDRVRGAALFADISGFTPLTEALASELGSQRASEVLTGHLNRVFHAVIAELDRYGGDVIYFSGDAITCWLDGDDGSRATALRPRDAGGDGRARARSRHRAGAILQLALKVAVAVGAARRFVVGDPEIQLIDVLAGGLIDRLADAEHLAEKGEVVVDGPRSSRSRDRVALRRARSDPEGGGSRRASSTVCWPRCRRRLARRRARRCPTSSRGRGCSPRSTSGCRPAAASSSPSCDPRIPCSSASAASTTTPTSRPARSSTSSSARRSGCFAALRRQRAAAHARRQGRVPLRRRSARRSRTRTTPRARARPRSSCARSRHRRRRATSGSASRTAGCGAAPTATSGAGRSSASATPSTCRPG